MTAYELELVAMAKNRGDSLSRQLADMLRQQQAEIEALRKELKRYADAIGEERGKTKFVHDYSSPFIELQKARE